MSWSPVNDRTSRDDILGCKSSQDNILGCESSPKLAVWAERPCFGLKIHGIFPEFPNEVGERISKDNADGADTVRFLSMQTAGKLSELFGKRNKTRPRSSSRTCGRCSSCGIGT